MSWFMMVYGSSPSVWSVSACSVFHLWCTYGLKGSFLVEMDHIRMPNNMALWCRRFPSKAIVLQTSISPSCCREANLMLFCASEMSSSKTYHSYIILWGAHKPRPFLAKTFRIESSIIVIDSYRAASMHPRHMLPHPFCGSALHSGHCPWHSMAFFFEKKNLERKHANSPTPCTTASNWISNLNQIGKASGTLRISQHTCATSPNLYNSNFLICSLNL